LSVERYTIIKWFILQIVKINEKCDCQIVSGPLVFIVYSFISNTVVIVY
jgi:hypothetical protein